MKSGERWLVITTVQAPTDQVRSLARLAGSWHLLSVGDEKTPRDWCTGGFEHLTLEQQRELGGDYARLAPVGHYSRKNLGYLLAVRSRASIIAETDDDNAPLESFLTDLVETHRGDVYTDSGWLNVFSLAGHEAAWPRGFPLNRIRKALNGAPAPGRMETIQCPAQQYLVDGDSDYDAVYRLTRGQPASFNVCEFALGPGSLSPFNSQATVWWPAAYPLMYLPSTVTFRATDIIRSYVAQVCLHAAGMGVAYLGPGMVQDRNPHDLMSDFEAELPIYLDGERMVNCMMRLELPVAITRMRESLRRCYEALCAAGFVHVDEMALVDAWLRDLALPPTAIVSSTSAT